MNIATVSIVSFVITCIMLYKYLPKNSFDSEKERKVTTVILTYIINVFLALLLITIPRLNAFEELIPHKYNLVALKSKDVEKTSGTSGFFITTFSKNDVRYYSMFIETDDGIKNIMYEMDDDKVFIKESDKPCIEQYWAYFRYPKWVQRFYFLDELYLRHRTGPTKVIINVPKGSIVREFNVSL